MTTYPHWICCQLGARESYAVARAIHSAAMLDGLITDIWARPGSLLGWVPVPALKQRYSAELGDISVRAANWSFLVSEYWRRKTLSGYELFLESNSRFQHFAGRALERQQMKVGNGPFVVFSYSYTARSVFEYAKSRGWKTVLGQVDLGPVDERMLMQLAQMAGTEPPVPAPKAYWDNWRKEVELADRIVVNSTWSKSAMLEEGIPAHKIATIPLSYDAPNIPSDFRREYPPFFTAERPMRVLFLGRIAVQKGFFQMIGAMRSLVGKHIELVAVGPVCMPVPGDLQNIRWVGKVPRHSVGQFYRDADVFLFPTFSDGFGLTQLEAQSWKLPVIASRYCGDVVTHGSNGWILPNIEPGCIADILLHLYRSPSTLAAASMKALATEDFSLRQLQRRLLALIN